MSTSFPERDRNDEEESSNPYRSPATSYVEPGKSSLPERKEYPSGNTGSYPASPQYHYGDSSQSYPSQSSTGFTVPNLNVKSILALFFSVLFPIAGLVLGIISMKEISRDQQEGRAFALTAVIVSSVYIAIGVLYVLFWGLIISSFGSY